MAPIGWFPAAVTLRIDENPSRRRPGVAPGDRWLLPL